MNLNNIFPEINDVVNNIEPLDDRVLLQIQYVYNDSIIQLIDETKQSNQFQKTLCKVLRVGANAFYSKTTGRKWVDVNPGDFVIAPRVSGQRILVQHPSLDKSEIHLLLVEDASIIVKIADPEQYLDNLVNKG